MLRVIGAKEYGPCSLVVDDYIPLSWRCAEECVPLYWYTGDLDRSLLEIGLVPESGMLGQNTLVAAGGCLRQNVVAAGYLASAQQRDGLPCCDTTPWLDRVAWPDMSTWEYREGAWMFDALPREARHVDDPGPFTVSADTDGVSIWLGDPLPLTVCYRTLTLYCGVGLHADLRLLHFTGLDADIRQWILTTIITSNG